MELSTEEMEALYEYFLKCGPISYEFHPEVHPIIDRIDEELHGPKGFFIPMRKDTND